MNHKISIGIIAVAVLAFFQSALRFHFALGSMGVLGSDMEAQLTTMLENPVADATMVIALPFLLLGAFGIVTAIGLLMRRPWGLYGMVALSLVTIAYDAWAILTIQSTAVMGIYLPVVFIVYLMARRDRILSPRAVGA